MISIQRPYAFIALVFIALAVFYILRRHSKIKKYLSSMTIKGRAAAGIRKANVSFVAGVSCRVLAAVCVVLAFAGISWGTAVVPVQKSGDAVSLVFDISYSMNAKDGPGGLSRLEAARLYSTSLLERMDGISVSVVLAKGDGIIAVPMTDDRASVYSIIQSMSPSFMTSSGSSIGKGIEAAMQSFPKNMSQESHIWVFTDGDETDSSLVPALEDAVRFAFPVTLIGFGTAESVQVLAGDGKTLVSTSLKAESMIDAVAGVEGKLEMRAHRGIPKKIRYLPADSEGSVQDILKELSGETAASDALEIKSVPHHQLFIFLALLLATLSFFALEFDVRRIFRSKEILSLCVFLSLPMISCRSGKASVLSGTFHWYQREYQSATAEFLRSYNQAQIDGDQLMEDFCAYNLASTYIMQDEYMAALSRLEQVSPDSPPKLKSAAFYNMGIISSRQGNYETAQEYFKKAVLEDSANMNARVNLEFMHVQAQETAAKSKESQMTKTSVNHDQNFMETEVFTLIEQEERERWKNIQSDNRQSSALDY